MSNSVLIIDDDTKLRNLLNEYLSDNNFNVTCVENAAKARKVMLENNFDVLVMDVMMPEINGLDFTKEIRKTSDIPILMLTAMTETEDKITGLESGADDYLSKPFEPKELLLRIKNMIRRSNKKT